MLRRATSSVLLDIGPSRYLAGLRCRRRRLFAEQVRQVHRRARNRRTEQMESSEPFTTARFRAAPKTLQVTAFEAAPFHQATRFAGGVTGAGREIVVHAAEENYFSLLSLRKYSET